MCRLPATSEAIETGASYICAEGPLVGTEGALENKVGDPFGEMRFGCKEGKRGKWKKGKTNCWERRFKTVFV